MTDAERRILEALSTRPNADGGEIARAVWPGSRMHRGHATAALQAGAQLEALVRRGLVQKIPGTPVRYTITSTGADALGGRLPGLR